MRSAVSAMTTMTRLTDCEPQQTRSVGAADRKRMRCCGGVLRDQLLGEDAMSKEDGGPAFPRDHSHDGHNGMSLRDYFAAKAMASILCQPEWEEMTGADVSKWAYEYADAMLKERAK
jgi:hypothetical protein